MNHTEAIVKLDNLISTEFTNKIISIIRKKDKKNLVVGKGLDTKIRDVKGCLLNREDSDDVMHWDYIQKEIERLYFYYKAKFPKMASNKINQIDLLEYSVGCKYNVHTDHYTDTPRCLSIIINLNEDYEGGDLVFTDQKNKEIKRFKLKRGSIVFFPSNFLYPHCIEPITKGTRYSIVAWLE